MADVHHKPLLLVGLNLTVFLESRFMSIWTVWIMTLFLITCLNSSKDSFFSLLLPLLAPCEHTLNWVFSLFHHVQLSSPISPLPIPAPSQGECILIIGLSIDLPVLSPCPLLSFDASDDGYYYFFHVFFTFFNHVLFLSCFHTYFPSFLFLLWETKRKAKKAPEKRNSSLWFYFLFDCAVLTLFLWYYFVKRTSFFLVLICCLPPIHLIIYNSAVN